MQRGGFALYGSIGENSEILRRKATAACLRQAWDALDCAKDSPVILAKKALARLELGTNGIPFEDSRTGEVVSSEFHLREAKKLAERASLRSRGREHQKILSDANRELANFLNFGCLRGEEPKFSRVSLVNANQAKELRNAQRRGEDTAGSTQGTRSTSLLNYVREANVPESSSAEVAQPTKTIESRPASLRMAPASSRSVEAAVPSTAVTSSSEGRGRTAPAKALKIVPGSPSFSRRIQALEEMPKESQDVSIGKEIPDAFHSREERCRFHGQKVVESRKDGVLGSVDPVILKLIPGSGNLALEKELRQGHIRDAAYDGKTGVARILFENEDATHCVYDIPGGERNRELVRELQAIARARKGKFPAQIVESPVWAITAQRRQDEFSWRFEPEFFSSPTRQTIQPFGKFLKTNDAVVHESVEPPSVESSRESKPVAQQDVVEKTPESRQAIRSSSPVRSSVVPKIEATSDAPASKQTFVPAIPLAFLPKKSADVSARESQPPVAEASAVSVHESQPSMTEAVDAPQLAASPEEMARQIDRLLDTNPPTANERHAILDQAVEQSRGFRDLTGDPFRLIHALNLRSNIAQGEAALSDAGEAADLSRQCGNQELHRDTLINLARLPSATGARREAALREADGIAQHTFQAIGDPYFYPSFLIEASDLLNSPDPARKACVILADMRQHVPQDPLPVHMQARAFFQIAKTSDDPDERLNAARDAEFGAEAAGNQEMKQAVQDYAFPLRIEGVLKV